MAATPSVNVYYGRPILTDVSRVLACLCEKEIDFKLVDMNDGQRMHFDALKLQTAARAPVPALEDGATFLVESRTICRYVSEKYAEQGNRYLLGRDLLDRGFIEHWLKTEEQSFNPPSWQLVFHLALSPLMSEADQVSDLSLLTHSEETLAKVLDVYEQRLRESEYLACDEFTLADLSHLPNTHYIANSNEWNHLLNSRKNVRRWWEKISNRPSWVKVVEILNEVEALKVANQAQITTKSCARPLVIPATELNRAVSAPQVSLGTTSKSTSPIPDRKPSSVLQNVPNSTAEFTTQEQLSLGTTSESTSPIPDRKPSSVLQNVPNSTAEFTTQEQLSLGTTSESTSPIPDRKPSSVLQNVPNSTAEFTTQEQLSLGTTSESTSPIPDRKPSSVLQNVPNSTAEFTIQEQLSLSQSPKPPSSSSPKSNQLASSTNAESTTAARLSSEADAKKTSAINQEQGSSSSSTAKPESIGGQGNAPDPPTSKPKPESLQKQGPSAAKSSVIVAKSHLKKDTY